MPSSATTTPHNSNPDETSNLMNIIIIGITDAPQPFFPPEVLDIIRRAKVFSGGKRHHQLVAHLLPEKSLWIDITAPLEAVFSQYRALFHSSCSVGGDAIAAATPQPFASTSTSTPQPSASAPLVVFASGDPLFFGFANTLRQRMPEARLTVLPAFNSLQLLAHRLLMPYHDMRIVSLTGRPWPDFDAALITQQWKIGVLTDRIHTPKTIAQRMLGYGYDCYRMYVGEHLGNPDKENVRSLTLGEAAACEFEQPNCLILEMDGDGRYIPFGIPDSAFELLDGRERMITKMPIRLLSLQAMQLDRRAVLWDVGFCTGSISIEARRLFPHLHIEAFEIREEGRRLIEVNARRFGAPGIEVHIGDFLAQDISALPRPDAVFIGGHGGRLSDIIQRVYDVMPQGGCIAMNSVTQQSQEVFCQTCERLGMQLQPARRIALDDYHPIVILTAIKPS